VTPIFSEAVQNTDTRFATARENIRLLTEITGNGGIKSITDAEQAGPQKLFDIITVAPCTGNTLAKIAIGITDNTVTMAVKAHLRNLRPVVIGVSSNDILGANAKNLGVLLNYKNIFFIPFFQDDPINKEKSVTFKPELMIETLRSALMGRQLQPVMTYK
jgi:dipicolinate synthase subunit B